MKIETRKELEIFVKAIAPDHIACYEAPEDLDELVAWQHERQPGDPLPVSNMYCDNTIFLTPAGNHAMRAWHDWLHILTGYQTEFEDEMQLGLLHAETAERFGLSSEAVKVLLWDMCGQSLYYEATGGFPRHQKVFVNWCLDRWPTYMPRNLIAADWPSLIHSIRKAVEFNPELAPCA